jgi:hypothetical protein
MNKELEQSFVGTGEVQKFVFNQLEKSDNAYMYSVSDGRNTYYEVFKKRSNPICVDFEKKIYSDTDTKDTYPKSNNFGVWAWSYMSRKRAMDKFNSLNEK